MKKEKLPHFRIVFTIPLLCFFTFTSFAQNLLPFDQWKYIQIDDNKGKWGDFTKPEWLRYFGLSIGDVNGDGQKDVVSGRYYYQNPGGNMEGEWGKADFGVNVDGFVIMDVDGDEYADVIAQALPDVFWLEAKDKAGTQWNVIKIAQVPATSHTNSQGFRTAQIVAGGKEEVLIAGNGNVYCIEVGKNPEKGKWKTTLIGENSSDEGIGAGDIDGDGDIDIAGGRRPEGGDEPMIVVWWENPGDGTEKWKATELGKGNHPIDRVEVADIDGDNKADVIIAEERWPGNEPDGNLFWYRQPEDSSKEWIRNWVVTQYSMNNLAVKDLDNDGDFDLITNEHKGPRLELQAWENDGKGNFTKHILDTGKEGHLGTMMDDLDGDGDLDIVSAGWDNYKFMHVWRNKAIEKPIVKWKHLSTINQDLPLPLPGRQQTASLIIDVDNNGAQDFMITDRTMAPSVALLRYEKGEWKKYIIEDKPLFIEAGSATYDIDGDGDLDAVFAGESRSNNVWWWENPYPNLNPDQPWERHIIKDTGKNKHHDQMFGDFDGDGKAELAFWNQTAGALMVAEIPENPRKAKSWEYKPIYTYSDDSQMEQLGQEGYPNWKGINEHEGLAKADINEDGIIDIVGGGRYFTWNGTEYVENLVDPSYSFTRSGAGQFIEGGRPEVLLVAGDGKAALRLYEWKDGTWYGKTLITELDNGHTLETFDFNNDGHLDIFCAEMRFGEGNPGSRVRILIGDGKGNFEETMVATGFGVHEGKIADLDGDGDYDVLGKPYSWKTPRIDLWINEGKE
ncbi:FG-GAP repeat domain-containing protein [Flexithrix dorotheae]|uniref:FG-GAP repeat domain-containing protein n=1 Tax=Flexithrix dorotheae TaxID=70993 RepID=UPI00035E86A7|nr:VCBS repeat-containing protein [Flexithrix dorotheae]